MQSRRGGNRIGVRRGNVVASKRGSFDDRATDFPHLIYEIIGEEEEGEEARVGIEVGMFKAVVTSAEASLVSSSTVTL